MDFKEKVIEYRKGSPSIASLSNKTDLFFLEKYGSDGKGGKFKYDGILIPGNIYFFNYNTDSKIGDRVTFINRNPILLYLSSERVDQKIIVKGIDLTLTPPDSRLEILHNFWDKFSSEISLNKKRVSEGNQPNPIRVNSSDLPLLFRNTGYNISFKGYKFEFMSSIKPVDYEDWDKLPYLKYTLIQGTSINEIYNNYRLKLKS